MFIRTDIHRAENKTQKMIHNCTISCESPFKPIRSD